MQAFVARPDSQIAECGGGTGAVAAEGHDDDGVRGGARGHGSDDAGGRHARPPPRRRGVRRVPGCQGNPRERPSRWPPRSLVFGPDHVLDLSQAREGDVGAVQAAVASAKARGVELRAMADNALLNAHVQRGDGAAAVAILNQMAAPDACAYATVVKLHSRAGQLDEARRLLDLAVKAGVADTVRPRCCRPHPLSRSAVSDCAPLPLLFPPALPALAAVPLFLLLTLASLPRRSPLPLGPGHSQHRIQLVRVDGLGQIVIHPGIQAHDMVILQGIGGHGDNGGS